MEEMALDVGLWAFGDTYRNLFHKWLINPLDEVKELLDLVRAIQTGEALDAVPGVSQDLFETAERLVADGEVVYRGKEPGTGINVFTVRHDNADYYYWIDEEGKPFNPMKPY